MNPVRKIAAALMLSLACAACAAISPEPSYYMLAPAVGDAHHGVQVNLHLQRPSLARYLDQPEFVTQDDAVQLKLDDMRRWAEPLDVMIERTLAADLRQRLPGAVVTTEDSGPTGEPQVIATVDIQRFNATGSGLVLAQAQVVLRGKAVDAAGLGPVVSFPVTLEGASASGGDEQATALSKLVGQLADQVAAALENGHLHGGF